MSKTNPFKAVKRKLLVQVASIVFAVFIVIILVTGTLIYQASKDIYLQAKNEMIIEDLSDLRDSILQMDNLPWVLEYCREHTDLVKSKAKDYMYLEEVAYDTSIAFYEEHGITDLSNPVVDPAIDEALRKAPEDVQLAVAIYNYSTMINSLYISQYEANYDKVYCLDISEEDLGFVYCEMYMDDPDHFTLGEKLDYKFEEHPAIATLVVAEPFYTDATFEITEVDDNGKEFYVGYLPVIVNKKICCTVCISFDFSSFRSSFMPHIIKILIIGTIIMLLFAGMLLFFLHNSAISPVNVIQKSVRRYIADKDSGAVAAEMEKITAHNEFGMLSKDISELAQEIDRYTAENIQLASEKEKVASELAFAAKIQNDMLPKDFPAPSRFDLYAAMNPAKEVGGDFYDFFFIDDNTLALVIADVSGKGIPASLFMMRSMIMIKNIALHHPSPADILSAVNQQLCVNNESNMFVTAWLGIIDLRTGIMKAANAGHEYPVIRKPDGRYEVLKDKHSFVMGASDLIKYKEYELQFDPGSKLFVYTDGAPEAQDADGEMFTIEGVCDALNRSSDASPRELLRDVTEAIAGFVKEAEQFDDLTMMSFFYYGGDRPDDHPDDKA